MKSDAQFYRVFALINVALLCLAALLFDVSREPETERVQTELQNSLSVMIRDAAALVDMLQRIQPEHVETLSDPVVRRGSKQVLEARKSMGNQGN